MCVVPITPQALLEASTGPGEDSRKPEAGNGTRQWPSGEGKLRGILESRVRDVHSRRLDTAEHQMLGRAGLKKRGGGGGSYVHK